ncbi:TPA: hypothetical protein ACNEJR_003693 [Escherichia coli]
MTDHEILPLPVIRFAGPENAEVGRIWIEGNKLHFDGNMTESATLFHKELVRLHEQWQDGLHRRNTELQEELLAMTHDRDRWKNHHETEVTRARVLKNRTDLPLDRRMFYDVCRALAVAEGRATPLDAEHVVTTEEGFNRLMDVHCAAERLVKCKGRYYGELAYAALAALFGQDVPVPLDDEARKVVSEDTWDKIQAMIKEPAAPSDALRELMTRPRRYIDRTKGPADELRDVADRRSHDGLE